ncbi:MAG: 50S ribosomal protein L9 [Clostridia bacterium]|nr:50S ribosomal protein L9 [Clostridia bacterium]
MKVILLQDVKSLGKKDDVCEVNSGYGNNFLINKGLAIVADNVNMAKLNAKKKQEAELKAEELATAKSIASDLENKEYKLNVKVGANGKIFGTVTSSEIADVIEKVSGHKVDKRKVVLKDAIKALGIYDVTVKLHPEVSTVIKVEING